MSKFESGVNVVIIDEEHTVRRGVIKHAYDELRLAVVDFQDGATEKVHYEMLGIEKTPEPQDEKKTDDKVEGVNITPYEFMKHVLYIAFSAKSTDKLPYKLRAALAIIVSGTKLTDDLFSDLEPTTLDRASVKKALIDLVVHEDIETKPIAIYNSLVLRDLIDRIFVTD